jgi:hypothetical protein
MTTLRTITAVLVAAPARAFTRLTNTPEAAARRSFTLE